MSDDVIRKNVEAGGNKTEIEKLALSIFSEGSSIIESLQNLSTRIIAATRNEAERNRKEVEDFLANPDAVFDDESIQMIMVKALFSDRIMCIFDNPEDPHLEELLSELTEPKDKPIEVSQLIEQKDWRELAYRFAQIPRFQGNYDKGKRERIIEANVVRLLAIMNPELNRDEEQ